MSNQRILSAVTFLLLVIAPVFDVLHADQSDTPRGAELLAPFKAELKQALVAGMQEGPVNAISVCKEQAPAIAASLSTDGVRMGRTSHRLRNPANTGPEWTAAVLESYLADTQDRKPHTVELPGDREGYAEPVVVQPLCLACHGEALAPDVAAHVEANYPEDQATGFAAGDLRGIFWVEYPQTAP